MNNSVFVIPFIKLLEDYFYNKTLSFIKQSDNNTLFSNKKSSNVFPYNNISVNNYLFYGFPYRENKLRNHPTKGFPKEVKRIDYPLYFRK